MDDSVVDKTSNKPDIYDGEYRTITLEDGTQHEGVYDEAYEGWRVTMYIPSERVVKVGGVRVEDL